MLGAVPARTPAEAARSYLSLRYDEDWSFLRDPAQRIDFWDPVKYIPLNPAQTGYLSLGGEARWRYEWYDNFNWGRGPQDDDGYLLQRYLLHADLRLGERLRFFGQLESELSDGRNGGPRPFVDENRFDLHQAFVDLTPWSTTSGAFTVRAGRQEIAFGAGRLLSEGEGFNVRRKFDGLRLLLRAGSWQWNATAMRLVRPLPGSFDDEPEEDRVFWGAGGAGTAPWAQRASQSVYYFGVERDGATYDRGTAAERRHTLGSRIWARSGSMNLELEGIGQWGRFGTGAIVAWALVGELGRTLTGRTGEPWIALRLAATSGDRDPQGSTLRTFSPLFPANAYGGRTALLGPSNTMTVVPTLRAAPSPRVTLFVESGFYWRQSVSDAIYSSLGTVLRTGQLSTARYIGSQPSVQLDYRFDRHLTLSVSYSHFYAGSFLRQTPPGEDIDFVFVQASYKF
jgi:tRNA(Leu) C34 or U34 (ribose-2'-O)-methylase TrmL